MLAFQQNFSPPLYPMCQVPADEEPMYLCCQHYCR